jgi:hypothetical protein
MKTKTMAASSTNQTKPIRDSVKHLKQAALQKCDLVIKVLTSCASRRPTGKTDAVLQNEK